MAYQKLPNFKQRWDYEPDTLEGATLTFLCERCEGLRWSAEMERLEAEDGKLRGVSGPGKPIPHNEQKDIDRLCLENAVRRFFRAGSKENAFDVYFCYLEMFVGDYEKTRRMIELLSEFEINGGSLLMKHRDHYVHSVYVFLLGLAIYETSPAFRNTYKAFYTLEGEHAAAHHFLEFWGMTSLFHDIGYPFELPCEQVASYFEVDKRKRKDWPFLRYEALEKLTALDDDTANAIAALYGKPNAFFTTTDELFAYDLAEKLSETYLFTQTQMLEVLRAKPEHPDRFGYFMDHAWFSATVLFRKFFVEIGVPLRREHIDALTAILMHNSLYKFSISHYKTESVNIPFQTALHPLAWMLMLCDELQCWDRTAYGRNSRTQYHPFGCRFRFRADGFRADYLFDDQGRSKFQRFEDAHRAWEDNERKGDEPELKAISEMYICGSDGRSKFERDIDRIVDLRGYRLDVGMQFVPNPHTGGAAGLSSSNFLNLYNFAIVLNGRWDSIKEWKAAKREGREDEFVTDKKKQPLYAEKFKELSLEYKLSNINQAKEFARLLARVNCFYTDQDVDFEMLDEFTQRELKILGPLEHHRWLQEHWDMGWDYAVARDEAGRKHHDMIPGLDPNQDEITEAQSQENYRRIGKEVGPEEPDKDTEPMECMLSMLRMFDGLRIYRLE